MLRPRKKPPGPPPDGWTPALAAVLAWLCVAAAILVLTSGCALSPVQQKRWFQAEIPGPPEKPAQTLEAERRAAEYLAREIADPGHRQVAAALSASLGAPARPIRAGRPVASAYDPLLSGIRAEQRERDRVARFLARHAGAAVQGTGIGVLSLGLPLAAGAILALLIFFPAVIPVIFWALRRGRRTLAHVVRGVQRYRQTAPAEAVCQLEEMLEAETDARDRVEIKKLKEYS